MSFQGDVEARCTACAEPFEAPVWSFVSGSDEALRNQIKAGECNLLLCPRCGAASRPNILMFGDYGWIDERTRRQRERFNAFLTRQNGRKIVVVELGAGTAIPTVRAASERIGAFSGARVIRINTRESQISPPHLSLPCGALEGLRALQERLEQKPRR